MIEHHSHNIQNIIQREIFNAKNSIKVVVAWFTNNLLFQPLLLKLMSGVTVELILNKDDINLSSENEIDFNQFVEYGGLIHWNTTSKLMHDKFCIIDDNVVISGSYNWTNKAEYNDESITLFRGEDSTIKFYNDSFARLATQYPISTDCCTSAHSVKREKCPVKQQPYTKLNFYNSIKIRTTHYHTYVFANECEGGLFALLDNQSFLPKTDYMFGEIPEYDSICDENKEYTIWIKGETSWGLFNCTTLEYIVIPQYEEVKWQREYYFVVRNGKYGVYNNKDEKLLNCEYDELKAWYGGIRLRKNGKYGIYYALGTGNLIQCEYDEVEYHNGYYILSQNGKYKLAYSGRLLAGYHFDKYICDSGYRSGIIVSKNNKYGIVYEDEFITAPIYDEYMSSFKYPESIIVRLNEKYGLYYRNNLVLKCEYDDLKINTPIIHKGKYGLVLEDGTIALDFIYDEIKLYKDHYYVIKNGKYSLYNSQHRRVENRWVDTEDAIRKSIDVEIMIKDFEYIQPITIKKFF